MTKIQLHNNPAPTLQELYKDASIMVEYDHLNVILNQEPPASWVKTNKFANNSKYIPIDKVEFLLRRIFKQFRIEVKETGVAFNGVYVVVRVHYMHPVNNQWEYHDGIGAEELQVKSGSSVTDLSKINKGAIAMAFPKAKSQAIKDACDHLGRAFGSDLNRKDTMTYTQDVKLHNLQREKEIERLIAVIEACGDISELTGELFEHVQKMDDDRATEVWGRRYSELTGEAYE